MQTIRRNYIRILAGILRVYYLKFRYPSNFYSIGLAMIGKNARVYLSKGKLYLQNKVVFSQDTYIDVIGIVKIGSNCYFNDSLRLVSHRSIEIGNHVTIASQVSIYDHDHAYKMVGAELILENYTTKSICIGNHVWIGEKVVVLKGVTIGDNVIIGAGSVVTCDIPSNCIAAGNPAKVIRTILEQ